MTKPAWIRALAMARSSRRTSIGSSVCEALSAKTSAVASRKSATSTTRDRDRAGDDRYGDDAEDQRPARVDGARPSARRSRRSESAPAYSPNSSGGSHWTSAARETTKALFVWEATSSGPAASAKPSPRLLVHDDPSSQRNPTPSRGGATVSMSPVTGAGGYHAARTAPSCHAAAPCLGVLAGRLGVGLRPGDAQIRAHRAARRT